MMKASLVSVVLLSAFLVVQGDFMQCYCVCFKKCKCEHPGASSDQHCHTSCFNNRPCKFDCHVDMLIGEFNYSTYFIITLILFAYSSVDGRRGGARKLIF